MKENLGILPVIPLLIVGAKVAIPAGAGIYVYNWFSKDKDKFPATKIFEAVKKSWYDKPRYTKQQINEWWDVYIKGVMQKGLDVYDRNASKQPQKILKFMQTELKLPTYAYILDFLTILQMLATKGTIERKYWDPASSIEAVKAVQEWKAKQTEASKSPVLKTVDKFSGAVKWASIAAVGGLAFYVAKPYILKKRK